MVENTDIRRGFGTAVRVRRHELGLTQEELAHRSGLSRNYVGAVERGEQNIGLDSIDLLARGLDLSLPALFERTDTYR